MLLLLGANLTHADKKDELNQLRDRIGQLQNNWQRARSHRSEVADALRTSEKAISEVNRNLVALGREQTRISQNIAGIKRQIEANRADTGRQQELLERMIRHQYMHGNTDGLRLLLDGQDVSEVQRQLHYFGYVSKKRAAIIEHCGATRAASPSSRRAARQAAAGTCTANADAQKKPARRCKLSASRGKRCLNRIKTDISKNRSEIGRLKRDEDRLTRLIEQLARAIAKSREERRLERNSRAKPSRNRRRSPLARPIESSKRVNP